MTSVVANTVSGKVRCSVIDGISGSTAALCGGAGIPSALRRPWRTPVGATSAMNMPARHDLIGPSWHARPQALPGVLP